MRKRIWVTLAVVAAVGLTFWVNRQILIDRCLDGGGAWDYDVSRCNGDQPNK